MLNISDTAQSSGRWMLCPENRTKKRDAQKDRQIHTFTHTYIQKDNNWYMIGTYV